jgi:hypothetical protein
MHIPGAKLGQALLLPTAALQRHPSDRWSSVPLTHNTYKLPSNQVCKCKTWFEKNRMPANFVLPLPGTFYPVFVILGFLLFDAGNILDAEMRVNQQRDIGDLFSKVRGLLTVTDHWMVGKDVWIGFSARIMVLIGR